MVVELNFENNVWFLLWQKYPPTENALMENYHLLLSYIEELYEKGVFSGTAERFFDIVERCAGKRPVSGLQILQWRELLNCICVIVFQKDFMCCDIFDI